MYTALNKATQEQERKNTRKDDVSDNNCSELYYYDYIIIIFVTKNYLNKMF